ncbi:hypothetical protein [Mycobacteroides chelonae]|uniref:hypothetical protein n=1 Tax=Mycobacteroides chelonae TaxID=1774 RepID=UPI0018B0CFC6|nr:hypothetical protein [Mycobacteroides chelonae]MBF9328496.1 hypothetical protein [Mycobacteroides chelonae]MBF9422674.1 hypothetical protein [Mycobacteroides chelonae]
MKRAIARALRKLANRLDPSRGWFVTVDNGSVRVAGAQQRLGNATQLFGEAGRKAADEMNRKMQSYKGSGGPT